MEIMEKMALLVNEKRKNTHNQEDLKKIEVIERLMSNPMTFFQLDANTIFGILTFLDVPEKEKKGLFFELLSPQQYDRNYPKVRISTSDMK